MTLFFFMDDNMTDFAFMSVFLNLLCSSDEKRVKGR